MTISYQYNVATASFAGFPKLLCRWKGSVYKLVFKEILVYACLYITISAIYRCALQENQRRFFEKICLHMEVSVGFIPLTFVLGFYVSFVVGRWWDQFSSYPWPDRMIRRTLVRYLNASTVLLTRSVSIVAKKRFPTFEHLVEAGLLTKDELKAFESVEIQYAKFWVPLVWFTQTIDKAYKEGLFHDPSGGVRQVMDELNHFRDKQGKIWAFDYVSVPIVYTQVVTLATYMYFVGCLFSRQFLDPAQNYENYYVDIYVPFFTLLQFFFYVGWLKVAESLINPWGEDDDDFEVNWFIDRHMQVSYAMVDDMYNKLPEMTKDKYWNERDIVLPYTEAAMDAKKKVDFSHLGSTMNLNVPFSSLPMRRPSNEALGSSADLVLRKRTRKITRQEDLKAYLPRQLNASIFEETTIAVPETPYGFKNKSPVNSDSENTHSESTPNSPNEHEYLAPGFPYVSRNEAENRFRKISSPARMKFFQPDKETVAKFNARLHPISIPGTHEECETAEESLEPDLRISRVGFLDSKFRQPEPPKTDSSEPLLSRTENPSNQI